MLENKISLRNSNIVKCVDGKLYCIRCIDAIHWCIIIRFPPHLHLSGDGDVVINCRREMPDVAEIISSSTSTS